jgi:hypothetical protein
MILHIFTVDFDLKVVHEEVLLDDIRYLEEENQWYMCNSVLTFEDHRVQPRMPMLDVFSYPN